MAERLYGLGSRMFSRAVLEGTLEIVIYPPGEGEEFPGVALAASTRLRSAAVAAMEGYLDTLQAQWPFRREPYRLGDARGTCLLNLRVLPELAPC